MSTVKIHSGFVGTTWPHYALCSTRPKFQWEMSMLSSNVTCGKCKRIMAGEKPSAWEKKRLKRTALSGEAK